MELTNTEIKIVVKNMAREMVKRATAKNAMQFKYGDKVTVDGKYEGVVQAVKDGYYEVRIFDGSHVVGTRVCYPKDVTARNAAKNASSLKEGDKVRKKNDPDRKGRIELITGGMAMVFWPEDQTTSGIALDKIEAANMIAKNAPTKDQSVAIVHYVRGGELWLKSFDTMAEAKTWATSKGMKRSSKPENDGEYYITVRDRYNNVLERY